VTRSDGARDHVPSRQDLIEAARLLGCDLGPDAVPSDEQPGDLLAVAALVLGAAEVLMVNIETEILQRGGTGEDTKAAADITALVATGTSPWANRRWLLWHGARLIHQLFMAEQRGALPPKTGIMAARCVYAAHQLLVDLTDDDDDSDLDRFPTQGLARTREELLIALNNLAELASEGDLRR
jgi:hypothetical protein